MSQFDETTERKAREIFEKENPHLANDTYYKDNPDKSMTIRAARDCRNSTKASLEILARGMREISNWTDDPESAYIARHAIAQVKARGDWPLPPEE
jgi:hypothetical protein